MNGLQMSPEIDKLAEALVVAVGQMTDIPKNKKANVQMKSGGSFGYSYADLGDTLSVVRPTLAANGLACIQSASSDDNSVLIWTTIIHASGQWITFAPLAMPLGRTAQETGSSITYGRRYALVTALGLAAEDDDAAGIARQPRPTAPRATKAPPVAPTTGQSRTSAEAAIRDAISALPSGQQTAVRTMFRSNFGNLADLDPAEHERALEWTTETIANLTQGAE